MYHECYVYPIQVTKDLVIIIIFIYLRKAGKHKKKCRENIFITIEKGIKYGYAIKAVGIEKSESALSRKVSFLLPKITPYPPSGLRAINTTEGILIQWDSPVNEQIKSFKVYREKLGKKPKLVAEMESKFTDFMDKLPSKSNTYFYTISVVNNNGIESNRSDEVGINY